MKNKISTKINKFKPNILTNHPEMVSTGGASGEILEKDI